MVDGLDGQSKSRGVARLAVLALKAAAGASTRLTDLRWVLLPETVALTSEELAARLNDRRKPLWCAVARTGVWTTVECHTITDPGDLWVHNQRALTMDVADSVFELEGRTQKDVTIRVSAYTESLIIPYSLVRDLFREYDIHPLAWGPTRPTERDRALGAVGALELLRSDIDADLKQRSPWDREK